MESAKYGLGNQLSNKDTNLIRKLCGAQLVSLTDGWSGNEEELAKAEPSCHSDIAGRLSEVAELGCHSDIADRLSEGAELRERGNGWRGGGRKYKGDGRQVQEDIASTFAFAVAIALPFRTSHFAIRISHFTSPHIIICIAPCASARSRAAESGLLAAGVGDYGGPAIS